MTAARDRIGSVNPVAVRLSDGQGWISLLNPLPVTLDGDIIIDNLDVGEVDQGAAGAEPWLFQLEEWLGSAAPTVGQKAMASSIPVVVASNQSNIPVFVDGYADGTLNNGEETSVAGTAVQILAADANRKIAIIQNTGGNTVRIGTTGVTATTGVRLVAGASLIFEPPHVPTNAIFAIRESGGATGTVFTTQVA